MTKYATSSLYKSFFGGNSMSGGALKKQSYNDFYDLMVAKKGFLLYVFSNLLVQLGITYYLMLNYKGPIINTWVFLFATIGILMIMIFVPMPAFMKFLLFCLFSSLFGISLSRINNEKPGNKEIIQMAVLQTMSVFGALFLFGAFLLATGIKLGFQFGAFLFYALLLLIVVKIAMIFSGSISQNIIGLSIVGIILFSLFIIYDTNKILQRDYYGDFITASMDYYLDIINLFMNLFNYNNNQ